MRAAGERDQGGCCSPGSVGMHPVDKWESMDDVVMQIIRRARSLFRLQRYDEALIAFSNVMALIERQDSSDYDIDYLEMHGSMVHNIASCFHHLRAFDVAQIYYEAAAQDFRVAVSTGSATNQRRLEFVNERLNELEQSVLPDGRTYCDSSGAPAQVPATHPFSCRQLDRPTHTGYKRPDEAVDAHVETAVASAVEDLCSRQRPLFATIPNALTSCTPSDDSTRTSASNFAPCAEATRPRPCGARALPTARDAATQEARTGWHRPWTPTRSPGITEAHVASGVAAAPADVSY